MPHYYRIKIS